MQPALYNSFSRCTPQRPPPYNLPLLSFAFLVLGRYFTLFLCVRGMLRSEEYSKVDWSDIITIKLDCYQYALRSTLVFKLLFSTIVCDLVQHLRGWTFIYWLEVVFGASLT